MRSVQRTTAYPSEGAILRPHNVSLVRHTSPNLSTSYHRSGHINQSMFFSEPNVRLTTYQAADGVYRPQGAHLNQGIGNHWNKWLDAPD